MLSFIAAPSPARSNLDNRPSGLPHLTDLTAKPNLHVLLGHPQVTAVVVGDVGTFSFLSLGNTVPVFFRWIHRGVASAAQAATV